MKKKIDITVEDKCTDCPFLRFEYDDNSYLYSGYFCKHPDVGNEDKIADEGAGTNYNYKMKKLKENKKKNAEEGLFPLLDETEPIDPFLIPDWCPLPNIEE